jgi:hypothetical protein
VIACHSIEIVQMIQLPFVPVKALKGTCTKVIVKSCLKGLKQQWRINDMTLILSNPINIEVEEWSWASIFAVLISRAYIHGSEMI